MKLGKGALYKNVKEGEFRENGAVTDVLYWKVWKKLHFPYFDTKFLHVMLLHVPFCGNWYSGNYSLLKVVNKILPIFSTFFIQFG